MPDATSDMAFSFLLIVSKETGENMLSKSNGEQWSALTDENVVRFN